MARGTDFGGVHSFTDLHLIQQSVEVSPAEPKINLIDIPGADGSKDLSEQPAGRVVYKSRKITWTFALYPGDKWDEKHAQVSNALNGRRCRITLSTDPDFYYEGRVAVKKYKSDGWLHQITVEATCHPYKFKQHETTVTAELGADYVTLQLPNSRRVVVPTIEVTTDATIQWGNSSFGLSAGSHRVLSVELQEGQNALAAKANAGTGSITVTYQEGSL